MKKFLLFSLLSIFFIIAFSDDAYSQRRGKKKKKSSKTDEYFDESGFVNRLWYGGTVNFPNFFGGNNYNTFSVGIGPMVGYKVLDNISVGPRVSIDYLYVKGNAINVNTGQVVLNPSGGARSLKTNTVSYSVGVFARAKVLSNFFGHVEYESRNTEQIRVSNGLLAYDPVADDVLTVKETENNFYLGAGYNSGGLWGYEIMLLYNVNEPDDTIDLPFIFRGAITYKF